eukprot:143111_1
MATQSNIIFIVNNCLTANTQPFRLKLKGDWTTILHKITTKIAKKWKVTQYSFSIEQTDSTITIKKDDAQQFESILSAMSSPITMNIISSPKTATTNGDTKEEQHTHSLILRYDNERFEYTLAKGFDADDDELFENILKSVQDHFKLDGSIKIFDFEDFDVVDMDDINDRIQGLDNDDDTLHLKIQCVPNKNEDIKANDEAPCVAKRMRDCTSDKVKDMMQFHHDITAKIRKNYRDDFTKTQIECENLYHVLESLNTARPRMEKDYDTMNVLWQQNILFWQRYAHMRLIQWNVETCITERVGIETVLFETKAFEGHEPFEHKYSQILQIIQKYHTLYKNADKSAFDVLLTSIKNIQIEIQPGYPVELESTTRTLQCTQEEKYRIYFYLDKEHVTKAFVQFTSISADNYAMKAVRKNGKLFYCEVNIPWPQHQTSTKVKFAIKYTFSNIG